MFDPIVLTMLSSSYKIWEFLKCLVESLWARFYAEAFTFQDESEKDEDHKKATKWSTKPMNPVGVKPGQALVIVERQGNGQDQK